MKDLADIRKEIDEIDKEILALFEKRMEITTQVAEYKIRTGKQVLDRERERQKLSVLSALASSDFNAYAVRDLFELIMAASRKKQYQLLREVGNVEMPEFEKIEKLDAGNSHIVFQGIEGAYSELAMKEYFGEQCDSFHVDTWKDAMEAIRNGQADYGVLPIENSTAGIVSENYDLLMEYDNYIVGDHILKIDHALLGLPEAELSDITCVYSHPQSLMQCSDYFEANRQCEKVSMKNNAVAARKVKEDGLLHQAAIASPKNADIYGLKVLKEGIANNKNNSTRFIIVTGKKVWRFDAGKISICFEIPHESGSLYHILSHFIYNGLNMTNIQSRPVQGRNWEYCFFVDFEGTFEDTAVQNALKGLYEETKSLKILGTY